MCVGGGKEGKLCNILKHCKMIENTHKYIREVDFCVSSQPNLSFNSTRKKLKLEIKDDALCKKITALHSDCKKMF